MKDKKEAKERKVADKALLKVEKQSKPKVSPKKRIPQVKNQRKFAIGDDSKARWRSAAL